MKIAKLLTICAIVTLPLLACTKKAENTEMPANESAEQMPAEQAAPAEQPAQPAE
jgi:hypothetical protein